MTIQFTKRRSKYDMIPRSSNSYQLHAPHRQSNAAAPIYQDAAYAAHLHARADFHTRRAVSAIAVALTPEPSVSHHVGKSHLRGNTSPNERGGPLELYTLSHVEVVRCKRYLKHFPTAAHCRQDRRIFQKSSTEPTKIIGEKAKKRKGKGFIFPWILQPTGAHIDRIWTIRRSPVNKKVYWHASAGY